MRMVFQIYIIITDYHSDGMAEINKTASDQPLGDIFVYYYIISYNFVGVFVEIIPMTKPDVAAYALADESVLFTALLRETKLHLN